MLKNLKFLILIISFITLILSSTKLYAKDKILSLDDYIEQVKSDNLTVKKSKQYSKSYELLKKKAKLVSAIKLYAFSEKSFAEQNQALQIFRFDKIYNQNNQIGLSQNSEYGLKTNLYYSLNNVKYQGLNPNFVSSNLAVQNSQSIPVIELSIPVWQNLFGVSTRASRDATYYENEAQKLSAKATSISELVNAEKSYWNLVGARNGLNIQKKALSSAEKILDYIKKKERKNLSEKSDVLQAKAMVESRKLLVKQAENFFKISARNFNKNRNISSDEIKEDLEEFNFKKLQDLKISNLKNQDRLDIKAQKAQMKSAISQAKIEEENNKPALNIYGSYRVNQVEKNRISAINNSFDNIAPSGKVGIELSMPLNLFLTSDIKKGARSKASAEKTNYKQKAFQQEIDWQNLLQNITDFKENLKLSLQVQNIQKLKLENERNLLKQGRTSTYQILVFEQEFSNAELNTQQIAQKLHELIAEQKLYNQEE
jgi:outer membrane protein TolC